jgi:hypothetical protein
LPNRQLANGKGSENKTKTRGKKEKKEKIKVKINVQSLDETSVDKRVGEPSATQLVMWPECQQKIQAEEP